MRRLAVVCLVAAAGPAWAERPGRPAILEPSIDAAHSHRDERVIVAGERVRIGFRVRGGRAPYRVTLASRVGDGRALIDAETTVTPSDQAAAGAEVAFAVETAAMSRSGAATLVIVAIDAAGKHARPGRLRFEVIGEDAPRLPAARVGLEVVDVAGRRRAEFLASERVTVRGELPAAGGGHATLRLRDAAGQELLRVDDLPIGTVGDVGAELQVPRLAAPGRYALELAAGPARLEGTLTIGGKPQPPGDKLLVKTARLLGGADERTARMGHLRRGEPLTVDVLVAGAARPATGRLALQQDGKVVDQIDLAQSAASTDPSRRAILGGRWTVPSLPPGPYLLAVEVTSGDEVATLFRQVILE